MIQNTLIIKIRLVEEKNDHHRRIRNLHLVKMVFLTDWCEKNTKLSLTSIEKVFALKLICFRLSFKEKNQRTPIFDNYLCIFLGY